MEPLSVHTKIMKNKPLGNNKFVAMAAHLSVYVSTLKLEAEAHPPKIWKFSDFF